MDAYENDECYGNCPTCGMVSAYVSGGVDQRCMDCKNPDQRAQRAHRIKMQLDAMTITLYGVAVQAGRLSLELEKENAGKSIKEMVDVSDWATARADYFKAKSQAISDAF